MNKFGKTMKDTFMEMSSSLAGWIDDASTHFSKGFKRKNSASTQPKKSQQSQSKATTPKKDIPQPEKC